MKHALRVLFVLLLLPLVESNYRVSNYKKDRALASLSMGGAQSLCVGLCNLDKFDWIGSFSAAIPDTDEFKQALNEPERINEELKRFWIGCGTRDSLFKGNQRFLAELEANKIEHIPHIDDGIHGWVVWRFYLNDVLPLLFK